MKKIKQLFSICLFIFLSVNLAFSSPFDGVTEIDKLFEVEDNTPKKEKRSSKKEELKIDESLWSNKEEKIKRDKNRLKSYTKNINESIKNQKSKINREKKRSIAVSEKLRRLSLSIKKTEEDIKSYDKRLSKLENYLEKHKDKYNRTTALINDINSSLKKIEEDIKKTNKEFGELWAKLYSSTIAKNKIGPDDNSAVTKVILSKYKESIRKRLKEFASKIEQQKRLKLEYIKKRDEALASIKEIVKKKDKLIALLKEKNSLLNKLRKRERSYIRELERINREQADIRRELARLKLINRKAINKIREKEREFQRIKRERLEAIRRAKRERDRKRRASRNYIKPIRKSVDTSLKTFQYTGEKYISPLAPPIRVVRRFGSYRDPIYNIKISNDSVSLQSKDNRVRNIIDGVVESIIKSQATNSYTVIVSNRKKNLVVVYKKLSAISDYIKDGFHLKKGVIIGRANKTLTLHIGKRVGNSYRTIDPLSFIKIR